MSSAATANAIAAQDMMFGGSGQRVIEESLRQRRTCRRCGMLYREGENIGTWRCRSFHPLEWRQTRAQRSYRCCGRPAGSPGCVSADHTECYEYEVGLTSIDEQVSDALVQPDDAPGRNWVLDQQSMRWCVHRIDPVAYANALDELHIVDDKPLPNPVFH